MPCYTVQLTSVEFKAQHSAVLIDALKALGYRYNYNEIRQVVDVHTKYLSLKIDLTNQEITYRGDGVDIVNGIKRQYSLEVIKVAAATKKWLVKKLADNNKMILRRF